MRRILRIWPLYYLVVEAAFFIWPNLLPGSFTQGDNSTGASLLFIFFLPNLAVVMYTPMSGLAHTWSIGTEEQFYLLWPALMKVFRKNRLFVLYTIIIGWTICRILVDLTSFSILKVFIWNVTIDCMAIGAVFAILLYNKAKLLSFLMNNYVFYITLSATVVMIGFGVLLPPFQNQVYSVLFGIIVVNFAANPTIRLSLENPMFNYLGKISYGLYMYHPLCIAVGMFAARLVSDWLTYPLVFLITIITAALSYKFIESPFLRLKERFATVRTIS